MKFAPAIPTSHELEIAYPLSSAGMSKVNLNRAAITEVLRTGEGFISATGACSLTDDLKTTTSENTRIARLPGVALQRQNFWKPRSAPESWWGLETTDPALAYMFLTDEAHRHGNAASELGHFEHVVRYGARLALAWFGGRNSDFDMKKAVALYDPSLPLAVKNPLSGEIDETLLEVAELNRLRGDGAAPVVMMFRGGENAKDPISWEKSYIKAFELTNGLIITDTAHGAEMAHDPLGAFTKSAEAQTASLDHLVQLATSGYAPVGVIIEASEAVSPVDPPMPLDLAFNGVKQLFEARMLQLD